MSPTVTKKKQKLREMTPEELQNRHDELWADLFGKRIKHALGQLESQIELRTVRREIALVKTLLTERGVVERSRRRVKTARPSPASKTKGKAAKTGTPAESKK